MYRLAILLALAAAPLLATPSGDMAILPSGQYLCELPGDALGPAGRRVPEADFRVAAGSSYESATGSGNYLLVGDVVSFTSGQRKGERFRRVSLNFLRRLAADGSESPLRCVRAGATR